MRGLLPEEREMLKIFVNHGDPGVRSHLESSTIAGLYFDRRLEFTGHGARMRLSRFALSALRIDDFIRRNQ